MGLDVTLRPASGLPVMCVLFPASYLHHRHTLTHIGSIDLAVEAACCRCRRPEMRGYRPSYFQIPNTDVDRDVERIKNENMVRYTHRVEAGLPLFEHDERVTFQRDSRPLLG